ncbi:MAG TPA: hypothetical protein VGP83_17295 [Pyrinomonadaceae bacterium]|jgi:hypothetical protein|nr:hypothetical protein [Pyrinomonadaceae bacterium]
MITLAAASVASTVIGGTTVDTAPAAAVTSALTNFSGPSVSIAIPYGTFSGGVFTPSAYTEGQSLLLDLAAGTFRVGNGPTLPIPGALLTSILNAVKAYRNGLESLAQQAGAAPGVITPW